MTVTLINMASFPNIYVGFILVLLRKTTVGLRAIFCKTWLCVFKVSIHGVLCILIFEVLCGNHPHGSESF